jgi:hypothetical protein
MKAMKLIDGILSCQPNSEEESQATIVASVELLAHDLHQVFGEFTSKLRWLLQEDKVIDVFPTWPKGHAKAMVSTLVDFYLDR